MRVTGHVPSGRSACWGAIARRRDGRPITEAGTDRVLAEHAYESRTADRSGGSLFRRVQSLPSILDGGALRRAVDLGNTGKVAYPQKPGRWSADKARANRVRRCP